jgi:hypothetical protein
VLNAAINSPEAKQFWAISGWLPEEIGIIIDQGQVYCYHGDDLKLHIQRGIHNITVYSLIGLAATITSGQQQKAHLVSLVNGKRSTAPYEVVPNHYNSCTLPADGSDREPVAPVQRLLSSPDQA